MKRIKTILVAFLLAIMRVTAKGEAVEAMHVAIGEDLFFDVQPEDSFIDVVGMISQHIMAYNEEETPVVSGDSRAFRVDFAVSGSTIEAKVTQTPAFMRNYQAELTDKEKEDVRYIVRTLANSSLIKIGTSESSLKKAGDRIDRIHPLRFLEFVFSDEELKVCMHNMHGRAWVWKEFTSGLIGSLNQESANNNLRPEFISDFANSLKISTNLINPSIQAQRWNELIEVLIAKIPRKQGSDRYDM